MVDLLNQIATHEASVLCKGGGIDLGNHSAVTILKIRTPRPIRANILDPQPEIGRDDCGGAGRWWLGIFVAGHTIGKEPGAVLHSYVGFVLFAAPHVDEMNLISDRSLGNRVD